MGVPTCAMEVTMEAERKLSSLEMTVLGLAWLRGPRKPYAIMKELSLSPSSHHRTRAGATYSVVKRLVGFGLLEQDELVRVTPAGEEALREWLRDPIPEADLAYSYDLVRLRTFFLGIVAPEERLRFVEAALARLREVEGRWRWAMDAHESMGEYFGVLGAAGAVLETRARIEWLEVYREFLLNPADSDWAKTVKERLDREH